MTIILNLPKYLLLLFTVLHISVTSTEKKTVDKISYLFSHSGWRKLTDVERITYWGKKTTLNEFINTPVTKNNCDTQIRTATIFLGCSYTLILMKLYYILKNLRNHCSLALNNQQVKLEYSYSCTAKLHDMKNKVMSTTIKLKGALDAMEQFHKIPIYKHKKQRFILKNVIPIIKTDATFEKQFSVLLNQRYISLALESYHRNIADIFKELEDDKKFCQLKSQELKSSFNSWTVEYSTAKSQQTLYDFFDEKLSQLIESTFNEMYNDLGFQFDTDKNETILPDPPVDSEKGTKLIETFYNHHH